MYFGDRFTRETAVCEGNLTRNCARRGGPTADGASKSGSTLGSVSRVKRVAGGCVQKLLGVSGCAQLLTLPIHSRPEGAK